LKDIRKPLGRYYADLDSYQAELVERYRNDPEAFIEALRSKSCDNVTYIGISESLQVVKRFVEEEFKSESLALTERLLRIEQISALKILEENSRNLGMKDDALELFHDRKILERADRTWYLAIPDLLIDIISGYGTQVSRVLGSALVCILVFSFAYLPFGVYRKEEQLAAKTVARWYDSMVFSVHMFMRVGYSGWNPTSSRWQFSVKFVGGNIIGRRIGLSRRERAISFSFHVLTTLEGALGWFTLGFFIATLARVWMD
jgi:hypothetical protein